jgi:fimbrial chaperone protein
MTQWNSCQPMAAGKTLAAILVLAFSSLAANAQALSVVPVNLFLSPGQKATSLTVTNQGNSEIALQTRAFAWSQKEGEDDQLTAADNVVLSPPIVKMAPGAKQVIRVILRQSPENREDTYRILMDQIPPPPEAGVVHMVLRLSIPIFAQPAVRSFPDVQFHLEYKNGQIDLVGVNAGNLHEKIRDIVLSTSDGRKLKPDSNASPYLLAGATRRWHFSIEKTQTPPSGAMQLTAHLDAGVIDEQVRFVPGP